MAGTGHGVRELSGGELTGRDKTDKRVRVSPSNDSVRLFVSGEQEP